LCESFITREQLDAPEIYYPLHARGLPRMLVGSAS
jgi:hypothetical protein